LPQDTIESARRHFFREFARDGHRSGLGWVMELPVIALGADPEPAVAFDPFDDLTYFQLIKVT
jgi:hypothetical protein